MDKNALHTSSSRQLTGTKTSDQNIAGLPAVYFFDK